MAQEIPRSDEPQPSPDSSEHTASPAVSGLREQIRPALVGMILLTLLTGIAFPLVLAAIALPLFSHQARGSLLTEGNVVVGSELIGQGFSGPGHFHPRPSAASNGYDALASGGTNLAPGNPKLLDGAKSGPGETSQSFAGIKELVAAYRRANGLAPTAAIPIDAVTRSGSGLDPHISPADAALQVPRVARQRRLSEEVLQRLVDEQTQGRQFGFLGEPRVSVLPLNRAVDRLAASATLPGH